MKRISVFKNLRDKFFKKEPIQAYELIPFRTRVRQYIRAIEIRSHGKISYKSLRKKIQDKFGIDIKKELNITSKQVNKLIQTDTVYVSKQDKDMNSRYI